VSSPDDQELLAPLSQEERDRRVAEGLMSVRPEEWGRYIWKTTARALVSKAMKDMEEPGAADVEVDGDDESGSWDEPATDWMNAKKAAVRKVMACAINDVSNLPPIGARVKRIVLQEGVGHLYFEDGSYVGFSIEDMMPKQSPTPCGHSVLAAPSSMDMVAAVRDGELLGAIDAHRRGAQDVRFWAIKVGAPFDLYALHDVPVRDARPLNDFGSRNTRFRTGEQAWAAARRYAESWPFRRAR